MWNYVSCRPRYQRNSKFLFISATIQTTKLKLKAYQLANALPIRLSQTKEFSIMGCFCIVWPSHDFRIAMENFNTSFYSSVTTKFILWIRAFPEENYNKSSSPELSFAPLLPQLHFLKLTQTKMTSKTAFAWSITLLLAACTVIWSWRVNTRLASITGIIRALIFVQTCSSWKCIASVTVARVCYRSAHENRLTVACCPAWVLWTLVIGYTCSVVVFVKYITLTVRFTLVIIMTGAELPTRLSCTLTEVRAVSVETCWISWTSALFILTLVNIFTAISVSSVTKIAWTVKCTFLVQANSLLTITIVGFIQALVYIVADFLSITTEAIFAWASIAIRVIWVFFTLRIFILTRIFGTVKRSYAGAIIGKLEILITVALIAIVIFYRQLTGWVCLTRYSFTGIFNRTCDAIANIIFIARTLKWTFCIGTACLIITIVCF